MPDLRLIAPPLTGEATCTIAEGPERQTWQRVRLDHHQLDYFCHDNLWPGWLAWENQGRYLSDATLRYLTLGMWPGECPGLAD